MKKIVIANAKKHVKKYKRVWTPKFIKMSGGKHVFFWMNWQIGFYH